MLCPQHFVGGNGPTATYPDPIPIDGSNPLEVEQTVVVKEIEIMVYPKTQVLSQDTAR